MPSRLTAVHPPCAIEGGRITVEGAGFQVDGSSLPELFVDDIPARLVYAPPSELAAIVPAGVASGRVAVRIAGTPDASAFVDVASPLATGLHQVDNPVFDR